MRIPVGAGTSGAMLGRNEHKSVTLDNYGMRTLDGYTPYSGRLCAKLFMRKCFAAS